MDAVLSRFTAPPLGIDARCLYPRLNQQPVPSESTSVVSYRQKARTLAAPATMIRDIDANRAAYVSQCVWMRRFVVLRCDNPKVRGRKGERT
jgi:hypothetical protein